MALSDLKIRKTKPTDKLQKFFDGEGLHLVVTTAGSKLWRLKYRFGKSEKLLSLGKYPDINLLEACRLKDDAKRLIAEGRDPSIERKIEKLQKNVSAENSFELVARAWHKSWMKTRTEKHAAQVLKRMELDLFPKIGSIPVNEVKALHIVAAAKAVEARGANDLARRAIQISGQVFRYAVGHGLADHNPARDIEPSDILEPVREKNYARVSQDRLPVLLQAINQYDGHVRTRLALHLLC